MSVQIIMERDIYLDNPATPITLTNALYVGDAEAQRIRFRCFQKHGQIAPLDLTDAVITAHFVRPDGGDVVIEGVGGCPWSYVDLPEACYVYSGVFKLLVRVTSAALDVATSVLYLTGPIEQPTTDVIIDPGTRIPSLEELLAQIDACEDATDAANAAADNANAAALSGVRTDTAEQGLSDTQKGNARANIAAGSAEDIARIAQDVKPLGIQTIPMLYPDRYYRTDEGTVDVNVTVNGTGFFDCTWTACAPGDKFTVSGTTTMVSGNVIRSAIWAFIDAEGTVISQETELEVVDKIITAPANAAKLVLNNRKYGQTITPGFFYGAWSQEIDDDVAALQAQFLKVSNWVLGKNKFYGIPLADGYLDSATAIRASASYKTTDYIDVTGYTYREADEEDAQEGEMARYVAVSPRIRMWAEYKADKTPNTDAKESGYHNTGRQEPNASLKLDEGTAFIRISLYAADLDHVQIEDSKTCTSYEAPTMDFDEVFGLNQHQRSIVETMTGNVLYGKKWAVCGDSFTAGVDSGTLTEGMYTGQKIVYPYIIGNRNQMEILSFFASGRTLAFPADPDTFVNSLTAPNQAYNYQNIPEDADYVTIYLGINDRHHAETDDDGDGEDTTGYIPIGTINDDTTESYYGAWNVVMTWLRTNRPKAHIGIIVTNGVSQAYRAAQIAIARKYGVPFLDMNGDDRTPCMIRSCNADIDQTVRDQISENQAVNYGVNNHPNNDAHRLESTFIEHFLRSL